MEPILLRQFVMMERCKKSCIQIPLQPSMKFHVIQIKTFTLSKFNFYLIFSYFRSSFIFYLYKQNIDNTCHKETSRVIVKSYHPIKDTSKDEGGQDLNRHLSHLSCNEISVGSVHSIEMLSHEYSKFQGKYLEKDIEVF